MREVVGAWAALLLVACAGSAAPSGDEGGGTTRSGDETSGSGSGDVDTASGETQDLRELSASDTGGETTSGGTTSTSSSSTDATTSTTSGATETSGDESESGSTGDDDPMPRVIETVPIAEVWSGHPVEFALVTAGDTQFVAYYDHERRMTVASRTLGERTWQTTILPTSVGWDSHNAIAMAVDADGYVHVSGNMHNVPLIYFRSTAPWSAEAFEDLGRMTGTNEGSCTYPEFFIGPGGDLVFAYRDGGSGNGNHIFNRYRIADRTWERLLDTPLTDGQGMRNAYPVGPTQGPDGSWHLVWVWRDTPDAATNHDLSYARSRDLLTWETGAGTPLALPVTLEASDVVDPVPVNGGMINNNTKVGFDAEDRPVVAYHKFDAAGNTQLYNARLEDGTWVVYPTSDWDYRWAFGGQGTLVFEIEVDGVQVQPDGTLTQTFYHARYGGWRTFVLDPDTLVALDTIDPPLPYPPELADVRSAVPEMEVRWQADFTTPDDPRAPYAMLRWETLPSNRDMPRPTIPPPTELILYTFTR